MKKQTELQLTTVRSVRLGILFTAIYGIATVIYKAWKLQTPHILEQRFLIVLLLFLIHLILLLASRRLVRSASYYYTILAVQIVSFTALAGYSIYSERGMASNAIVLFVVPILIAALSKRGSILAIATTLCATVYSTAAVIYFRQNPSEGYKVELYGGLVFYCLVMYLISALIWVLAKTNR